MKTLTKDLNHILNYVNLLKIYVKRKFNGKNMLINLKIWKKWYKGKRENKYKKLIG